MSAFSGVNIKLSGSMNTNFMTAKAESPTMNDTIPLPTLIRRLLLLDSVFSLLICFNLPTDFVLNLNTFLKPEIVFRTELPKDLPIFSNFSLLEASLARIV